MENLLLAAKWWIRPDMAWTKSGGDGNHKRLADTCGAYADATAAGAVNAAHGQPDFRGTAGTVNRFLVVRNFCLAANSSFRE